MCIVSTPRGSGYHFSRGFGCRRRIASRRRSYLIASILFCGGRFLRAVDRRKKRLGDVVLGYIRVKGRLSQMNAAPRLSVGEDGPDGHQVGARLSGRPNIHCIADSGRLLSLPQLHAARLRSAVEGAMPTRWWLMISPPRVPQRIRWRRKKTSERQKQRKR